MNIPLKTHYLLQAHLSGGASNESTLSLHCIKSKCFGFVATNMGLRPGVSKRRQTEQEKNGELPKNICLLQLTSWDQTLARPTKQYHLLRERTQRHFPLFSFMSPVTSTRELRKEKASLVWLHSANTFSLAAMK